MTGAVNQYLPWAVSAGANVENAATFAADADLALGFVNGTARVEPANTLWRQHSVVVSAIAQFIVDTLSVSMNDDGDATNFKTKFEAALSAAIAAAGSGGTISPATAAMILAWSNNTNFVTALAMAQAMQAQTLTDASTVAWNMANGYRAKWTLGGNHTLGTPSGLVEGLTGSLQMFYSGAYTPSFASCWDFRKVGAPTWSSVAGKRDMLWFECVDAVTPVLLVTSSVSA